MGFMVINLSRGRSSTVRGPWQGKNNILRENSGNSGSYSTTSSMANSNNSSSNNNDISEIVRLQIEWFYSLLSFYVCKKGIFGYCHIKIYMKKVENIKIRV